MDLTIPKVKIRTTKDGVSSVVRDDDDNAIDLSVRSRPESLSQNKIQSNSPQYIASKFSDQSVKMFAEDSNLSDHTPADGSSVSGSQCSGQQSVVPVDQLDEESINFCTPSPEPSANHDSDSCSQLDITAMNDSMMSISSQIEKTPTNQNARNNRPRADSSLQMSRVGSRVTVAPDVSIHDAFEYFWPAPDVDADQVGWKDKEPDWFMVQEVISEMLQVKSFKRKYPDLLRRPVDGWEKSWLLRNNLVPATLADLGLTALRSEDVLLLLERDYSDIYAEVGSLLNERRIQAMKDKQKEQYQTSRLERGVRLEQSRQKAVNSAAEFNSQLVRERKRERVSYWDLQTMQIHVKRPKIYKASFRCDVAANDNTNGSYPVALIPGQFTDRVVKYSQDELKYLPVNKSVYLPPKPVCNSSSGSTNNGSNILQSVLRPSTPGRSSTSHTINPTSNSVSMTSGNQQLTSTIPTLNSQTSTVSSSALTEDSCSQPPPNSAVLNESDSSCMDIAATRDSSAEVCTVCKEAASDPVRCSDCQRKGHPKCLELPDNMVEIVKTYAWSCMECKKCVECLDPGHEDLMMFCDRCDRGYHAFCVGLAVIPEGQWECPSCLPDAPEDHLPLAKVRKTVRGKKPGDGSGGSRKLFQSAV